MQVWWAKSECVIGADPAVNASIREACHRGRAVMNHPAIRIAVLHFSHETVTFLKNDTTLDDFIFPGSPASGEALLGAIQNPIWAAS